MTTILSALGVPRSSYYRWLVLDLPIVLSLEEAIIALCKKTKYRNGHRKIKAFLKRDLSDQTEPQYSSKNHAET